MYPPCCRPKGCVAAICDRLGRMPNTVWFLAVPTTRDIVCMMLRHQWAPTEADHLCFLSPPPDWSVCVYYGGAQARFHTLLSCLMVMEGWTTLSCMRAAYAAACMHACMVMLLDHYYHAFTACTVFDSWPPDIYTGTNRMVLDQIRVWGKIRLPTRVFSSWRRLKKPCAKHHSSTKFRYQLNLGS